MSSTILIGWWAFPRLGGRCLSTGVVVLALVANGCTRLTSDTPLARDRQAVALLLPDEVKLVSPFTGFANFDDEPSIDGIELCVQPLNTFEEPTRLVGTLRVELLSYVGPSGDPRGKQLAQWEVPLSSKADQNTHWNRATQMYELHLEVDRKSLESKSKYVLQLTATDTFGSMFSSHHVIELDRAPGAGRP